MQHKNPLKQLLPWGIALGILVTVLLTWGKDVARFITGQDIIDDLAVDLGAAALLPTPTPVIGSTDSSDTEDVIVESSSGDEQLASDGFPAEPRQHVLKYTVQPGDALFLIAEAFDLDPNTIFWANTETLQDNVHLLYVGVELYILPEDGVYHLSDGTQSIAQISSQYSVTPGDILYSGYNNLTDFDSTYVPPAGLRIVVPNGRREYISWQAPIRTGTQSGASNPEGRLHPGSCREYYTGTGGLGEYVNPLGTIPYRVTSGFAPWHPGVDFASDRDTPIYSAETGVVVFAGWHRDGYGEMLILDHGDGWTTYYGHLATRFVGCGDQVSKGQYIAQMGMTGNASGIHLHFEVRENDIPQNPYSFFDIRDMRTGG